MEPHGLPVDARGDDYVIQGARSCRHPCRWFTTMVGGQLAAPVQQAYPCSKATVGPPVRATCGGLRARADDILHCDRHLAGSHLDVHSPLRRPVPHAVHDSNALAPHPVPRRIQLRLQMRRSATCQSCARPCGHCKWSLPRPVFHVRSRLTSADATFQTLQGPPEAHRRQRCVCSCCTATDTRSPGNSPVRRSCSPPRHRSCRRRRTIQSAALQPLCWPPAGWRRQCVRAQVAMAWLSRSSAACSAAPTHPRMLCYL
jgi:hypothetical protein